MEKTFIIKIALGLIIGGSFGAVMGYFGKCSTGACPLTANPLRGTLFGMLIGGLLSLSLAPAAVGTGGVMGSQDTLTHAHSMADFDHLVLQANSPVLVDFYSDTCPPCIALAPTLAEVAGDYQGRATVIKVNVRDLAQAFQQYRVSATPTVIVFQNGKEVDRIIGLRSKSTYTQALDKCLSPQAS